jgi:hypothetical protein
MAVYRLIANGSFGPAEIKAMTVAFEAAVLDLGPVDRDDVRELNPFHGVAVQIRAYWRNMSTTKHYQRYAVRCLQEARTETDSQPSPSWSKWPRRGVGSLNMRLLI